MALGRFSSLVLNIYTAWKQHWVERQVCKEELEIGSRHQRFHSCSTIPAPEGLSELFTPGQVQRDPPGNPGGVPLQPPASCSSDPSALLLRLWLPCLPVHPHHRWLRTGPNSASGVMGPSSMSFCISSGIEGEAGTTESPFTLAASWIILRSSRSSALTAGSQVVVDIGRPEVAERPLSYLSSASRLPSWDAVAGLLLPLSSRVESTNSCPTSKNLMASSSKWGSAMGNAS
ncbi:hypothetical protein GOODEAATRI_016737 [Goodea atripinnis]|uniref:Uncharacterized protein n=1 Tax=Goodea atripinnis TaxID=208336 RepID=A0ABV0MLD9_9TELE